MFCHSQLSWNGGNVLWQWHQRILFQLVSWAMICWRWVQYVLHDGSLSPDFFLVKLPCWWWTHDMIAINFLLVIIPFIQVVTRGFGITPRTNMPKKITYQQFPQWNSEDLLINDENILKQHILPNYKSCQHESHHRKTICSLNHLSPPMLMRTLMILM